jgi:hypothetical protein
MSSVNRRGKAVRPSPEKPWDAHWSVAASALACVSLVILVSAYWFDVGLSHGGVAQVATTPPDRQQLGNAGWLLLHKIATQYAEEPTPEERERLQRFLADWSQLYPCDECAGHFRQMLAEFPPDVSGRIKFMQWLCQAHNRVNKRLGHPEFPCTVESLEERWGGCGCAEGGSSAPSGEQPPADASSVLRGNALLTQATHKR